MGVRVKTKSFITDGESYEIRVAEDRAAVQIELQGVTVDQLKAGLDRAMNTDWPKAPQWMKDLADALE
jgi:hypothetical protein